MKYKVGDRVKIIGDRQTDNYEKHKSIGEKGVIDCFRWDGSYDIDIERCHISVHEDDLKLIIPKKKPKKKKNKLEKRVKKLEKIVKKLQANQEEDGQVICGILAGVAFGEIETPNKKVINPK